jgi:adenosylcobinamide-GDP ribazoletransferase
VGDGLRLAVGTLTVLPVRPMTRLDRRTAGRAMTLAPVVGVGLGLAAGVVAEAGSRFATPLLGAALAVAVLALLTRGLHLDGLADTADGLASYRAPEQALAVMRSPETGPVGVVVLVLVLLVQVAALQACLAAGRGGEAVLLAAVAGRLAVTAACTPSTPAAAPTGLGAMVAGTVRRGIPLLLALALAAIAAAVALQAAAAVVVGLLVARVLRRHAVRRIGGINGDVLGALVETTTAVVLVVLAVSG